MLYFENNEYKFGNSFIRIKVARLDRAFDF